MISNRSGNGSSAAIGLHSFRRFLQIPAECVAFSHNGCFRKTHWKNSTNAWEASMNFSCFSEDYVQRLATGDPEVENHFTGYFGGLLRIKLKTKLRSANMIEDVRQETFLRVLATLRDGRLLYPDRLGGFVNSVCNNVLL